MSGGLMVLLPAMAEWRRVTSNGTQIAKGACCVPSTLLHRIARVDTFG